MNTTYLREAVFVSQCYNDDDEVVVAMTKLVQCKDEATVMILHQHMGETEVEVKDCVTNDSAVEGHDMFFGVFQKMCHDEDFKCMWTNGPEPDAAGFMRRMKQQAIRELKEMGLPDGLMEALQGMLPEQRESEDNNVVPIGTGYGMYL